MAKFTADIVLEQALNYVDSNAIEMYVCSAEPANYAGISAVALTGLIVPTFGAIADGDVSGRKLPSVAKSGVAVIADGDATHLVLATATVLLHVTTTDSQTLTNGNTVDVPAWDIEFLDVTA